MAERPKHSQSQLSDDDLLKKAIPIEQMLEEEDEADDSADESKEGYVPVVDLSAPETQERHRIETGEKKTGVQEEDWTRQPNASGRGATHVKTFVGKLNKEGLAYLDVQINRWLGEHPDVDVKFATTIEGTLQAKVKEPHLIVNVWV